MYRSGSPHVDVVVSSSGHVPKTKLLFIFVFSLSLSGLVSGCRVSGSPNDSSVFQNMLGVTPEPSPSTSESASVGDSSSSDTSVSDTTTSESTTSDATAATTTADPALDSINDSNRTPANVQSSVPSISVPSATSVSPTTSGLTGGISITVSGTDFRSGAAVSVGGQPCTSVNVASSSFLTCSLPAGTGIQNIVITNSDSGTATLSNAITYKVPPTITSVSPTTGFTNGGTTLTVTGTGFVSGNSVSIGGTTCTSPTVISESQLTCTLPALGSTGSKSAVITDGYGQSGSLANAITYYNPATRIALSGPTTSLVSSCSTGLTATVKDASNAATVTASAITVNLSSDGAGSFYSASNCTGAITSIGISQYAANSATFYYKGTVATNQTLTASITGNTLTSGTSALNVASSIVSPTLSAVSPTSGPAVGGIVLTLTGTGFQAGATVTVGGQTCTVPSVDSATQITCNLPTGSAGTSSVVVTNSDSGSVTGSNIFTYIAAPTLASVSTTSSGLSGGTTITLTGTLFSTSGTVTVKVGGSTGTACANVTVVSSTSITCDLPAMTAAVYSLYVQNADGQSVTLNNALTYYSAPTVTAVSPTIAFTTGGGNLVITGTGFRTGATVTVGGTTCTSPTIDSSTQITCTLPSIGTSGSKAVAVSDGFSQTGSLANAVTYYTPATKLILSGPSSVLSDACTSAITVSTKDAANASTITSSNTTVNLTSTGAGTFYSASNCTGAITSIQISQNQSTSASFYYKQNGVANITLTAAVTGNVLTSSDLALSVASSIVNPTFGSISPSNGPASGGIPVTITGTGFQSGAAVSVGGQECTVPNVDSATQITCNLPAGSAGVAYITITNLDTGAVTANNAFTFNAGPTLTSINPNISGLSGTGTLSLTGTNFKTSGTTVVKIGGVGGTACSSVSVSSATAATCTLPAKAAGTYAAYLQNPDGQSATLNSAITYYDGPTATSVTPTLAFTSGGGTATITGTGFRSGDTVSIGGVDCASVSIVSSTQLTCTIPSQASIGAKNLVVTDNTNQNVTLNNAITYYGNATKLAVTGSTTGDIDACVGPFAATLKDASDNTSITTSIATVNLTAASGTFYDGNTCANPITSTTIAANGSTSSNFYYKNSAIASYTLTAASGALTNGTIGVTLTSPIPYIIADVANKVFPSSALDQGVNLAVNFGNYQTGTETDTGMTYACNFDQNPNGTLWQGTDCSNLPGTYSFDTGTGVLSWTPNTAAVGPFELVITGTNGTGTGTKYFTVNVRELYNTPNLVANYDAQFATLTGPPSNPLATWKDLTSNAFHATVPNAIKSNWGGSSSLGTTYYLNFDGSAQVSLPLSTTNTNLTQFSFGTWIKPTNTSLTDKVILTNRTETGNGFDLKQPFANKGRIELQIGNVETTNVWSLRPIHYYRLDEAGGSTTVTDAIMGGTGTVTGAPTFNVASNFPDGNKAATFGTGKYITASGLTDLPSGNAPRTACAWATSTTIAAGYGNIVNYGTQNAGTQFGLARNAATVGVTINGTYNYSATISTNTWFHVCGTFDGTNLNLYLNGNLTGSTAASPATPTGTSLKIATDPNNGNVFSGTIDEVAIFDYALDASQVSQLYNATSYSKNSCLSKTVVPSGEWLHLGGFYDGSTAKLYVNGNLECSQAIASGFTTPSDGLTLGGRSSGTKLWSGQISNLAFYSAASDTNITTHESATRTRHIGNSFCNGSALTNAPFATSGSTGADATHPHYICTIDQLKAIQGDTAYWDDFFELKNNINAIRTLSGGATYSGVIGNATTNFTGTFSGNGYTLSNLTLGSSASDSQGMFGVIGTNGTVQNLKLTGLNLKANNNGGGIAGIMSGGTIQNVYVAGTIACANDKCGGIVGYGKGSGTIAKSSTTVTISGATYVGGVLGYYDTAGTYNVQNVYANGSSSSPGVAGGILGYKYNSGTLNITNVLFRGTSAVGGVAGNLVYAPTVKGGFTDSSTCTTCSTIANGSSNLSTAILQQAATYISAGWDFTTTWTMHPTNLYPVLQSEGYSSILPTLSGSGTQQSPYIVSNANDMNKIASDPAYWANGIYIKLGSTDIDYNGGSFPMMGRGSNVFAANFDGNGKKIMNIALRSYGGATNVGMFGTLTGTVSNLVVTGASVTGNTSTGIIAGTLNGGTIQNVGVSGTITVPNTSNTGGLIGYAKAGGTILQCYSLANISGGNQYTGGLVGFGDTAGTLNITDSYAAGTLSGASQVGGIYGYKFSSTSANLKNTYFKGTAGVTGGGTEDGGIHGASVYVPSIAASFYDSDLCTTCSQLPTGVNGYSTTVMQQPALYIGAGWDFMTTWTMNSSDSYPQLLWESGATSVIGSVPGTGTSQDPYVVDTIAHLNAIAANSNYWASNVNIKLGSPINFNGAIFPMIANGTNKFAGTFDGNFKTLSNFVINTPSGTSKSGMFRDLTGSVKNLYITNATVNAGNDAGIIAGYFEGGTITKVGINSGSVSGAAKDNHGGFVGTVNGGGTISYSYSKASVSGQAAQGGLVGMLNNVAGNLDIFDSYVDANITGTGNFSGGILGVRAGTTVTVSVNRTFYHGNSDGSGTWDGGIYGGNGTSPSMTGNYYDSTACTTGCTGSFSGVSSAITANMQQAAQYISAGWDFIGTWTMNASTLYPQLLWEPGSNAIQTTLASGTGTAGDPYLISNATDLNAFAANSAYWASGVNVKLTAPINLSGNLFPMISNTTNKYAGVFDGNFKTISNFVINTPSTFTKIGMFRNLTGTVKNLVVSSATVNGTTDTGIITGYLEGGTITKVGIDSGTLSGTSDSHGGLVGTVNAGGTVSYSYSKASVSGQANQGGLVGTVNNVAGTLSIYDSYATGAVTGTGNFSGGILGQRAGTTVTVSISRTFYSGNSNGSGTWDGGIYGGNGTAPATSGSYYDSTNCLTGGCSNTVTGVTAKATSLMQTAATYSGWDTTTDWTIVDGAYPKLKWEP